MEPESESEKTPLLNKDTDQGWPTWRVMLVIATTSFYVIGIMPVAINSPLVPALEDDDQLGWNTVHSGLILSIPIIFEACGLISLGWLADVYGGPKMMVVSLTAISLIIGMVAWQQNPLPIIALMGMIAFIRGIVWPAATKLMNTYLGATQWEVGLCLIGLASRTGDLLTSELIGVLMMRFGWRGAICAVAGITVVAVLAFQLVMWKVQKTREGDDALEPSDQEQARDSNLAAPRWEDLKAFYCEPDTWAMVLLAILLQPLWVWGSYVATFAHSIYGISASYSALTNGSFAFGQGASLLITLTVTLCLGRSPRRILYIVISICSLLATGIPVCFLLAKVPFNAYILLSGTIGLCVGTIDYVPIAVWCMHVSRRTGDYALYVSSIYSIAYIFGAITSYVYGNVRKESEKTAFQVEMIVAAICLFGNCLCLTFHVLRNWDGTLFKYRPGLTGSSDAESSHA